MQKEPISLTYAGTALLGDLFKLKYGKNKERDFDAWPLPYPVDVFYFDTTFNRDVILINLN